MKDSHDFCPPSPGFVRVRGGGPDQIVIELYWMQAGGRLLELFSVVLLMFHFDAHTRLAAVNALEQTGSSGTLCSTK